MRAYTRSGVCARYVLGLTLAASTLLGAGATTQPAERTEALVFYVSNQAAMLDLSRREVLNRLVYNYEASPSIPGGPWPKVTERAEPMRVSGFVHGLAQLAVRRGEVAKYGLVDQQGKVVVDAEWDKVSEWTAQAAVVHREGRSGVLGVDGRWWKTLAVEGVAALVDDGFWVSEHWAVKPEQRLSFYSPKGDLVTALDCDELRKRGVDRAAYAVGGLLVLTGRSTITIDNRGRIVFERPDVAVWGVRQGLMLLWGPDRRMGVADLSGKIVVEPTFDDIMPFHEGRAAARLTKDGLWGFIDARGRWVVPPRYSVVGDFTCGRARVLARAGWGYIDLDGRETIPPQYRSAGDFHEDHAAVEIDGKLTFIDTTGKVVVRTEERGRVWLDF